LTLVAVAGAVTLLGVSAALQGVGLSSTVGPTAAAIFLACMAIAIVRIPLFHPFAVLGPANLVTVGRTGLVAFVMALAAEAPTSATAVMAVVISSVAAALDGWDGWLARQTGMSSRFGSRFDMEVDALLILILGLLVWRHEKAGGWVLLSGALRYVFVIAGWAIPWLTRELPPSLRRKTVCVIQIVGLIVAVAPVIPRPLSDVAAGGTLALLAWSFAVDVGWLWRARGLPWPAGLAQRES
jgi:phosphatidylglycerophosphate synthase